MTGDTLLLWFVTTLVVANVGLVLVMMVGLLPRALRTTVVKASFPCPRTGRPVVVRFLADERERPLAVMACTAFADPTTVACDQACLPTAGQPPRVGG
jgi:hypothetical protein